ncbi:hypothetical protein P170DRAFT_425198 [Aspergillus steynii IBT 23096]|uniref:Uncharacterized protein n=1 Tax=Aspergillus steynii IBT 23096 TaxID=1392250 RepID=A0A2I2GDJ0_9EURO|nr:uncharacterized protein P170DRAFT_425198 [Aspergillus steynii IBT 23096]PLB50901.1 hypothetical protein P170DRAFT_425198 [Aspergillus steynii IBT 23096]
MVLTQQSLVSFIHHLSCQVDGATSFSSLVSFSEDFNPLQNATQKVLEELQGVLGQLRQQAISRSQTRPAPECIPSVLEGCRDAVQLVHNQLHLYQYTCGGKEFVNAAWMEPVEALQHYKLILEQCIHCMGSEDADSLGTTPAAAALESLKSLVLYHLERQSHFQAFQLHDPYQRAPSPTVCSHSQAPSTYVTPPQSVNGGEAPDRSPTPHPLAAFSQVFSHRVDRENEMTDVDIRTSDGSTPLYWTIEEGHADMARILIEAQADMDTPHPKTGLPPLYLAVQQLRRGLVKVMITKGANPALRIPGKHCSRCKKAKRPQGRNSRCVLMAIERNQGNEVTWQAIDAMLRAEFWRRNPSGKSR